MIITAVLSPVLLVIDIWFTAVHHPRSVFLIVIAGICVALTPLAILKYERQWKTEQKT